MRAGQRRTTNLPFVTLRTTSLATGACSTDKSAVLRPRVAKLRHQQLLDHLVFDFDVEAHRRGLVWRRDAVSPVVTASHSKGRNS